MVGAQAVSQGHQQGSRLKTGSSQGLKLVFQYGIVDIASNSLTQSTTMHPNKGGGVVTGGSPNEENSAAVRSWLQSLCYTSDMPAFSPAAQK